MAKLTQAHREESGAGGPEGQGAPARADDRFPQNRDPCLTGQAASGEKKGPFSPIDRIVARALNCYD